MLILFHSTIGYTCERTHRCHAKKFWFVLAFGEIFKLSVSGLSKALIWCVLGTEVGSLWNAHLSHIMKIPEMCFCDYFCIIYDAGGKMSHPWWCYARESQQANISVREIVTSVNIWSIFSGGSLFEGLFSWLFLMSGGCSTSQREADHTMGAA